MIRNVRSRRSTTSVVFVATNQGPRGRILKAFFKPLQRRPEKRRLSSRGQVLHPSSVPLSSSFTYALRLLRRSFSRPTDLAFADSARSLPEHLAGRANQIEQNPSNTHRRIFQRRTFSWHVSLCYEITKFVENYYVDLNYIPKNFSFRLIKLKNETRITLQIIRKLTKLNGR